MPDEPDMSELDAAVQRIQDTYAREPALGPRSSSTPPPLSDVETTTAKDKRPS